MSIALKRVYDKPSPQDGYRVLVDRLWPRGLFREEAKLDEWMKEAAPSDQLRKLFHAGTLSWREFRRRYLSELKRHRESLRPLATRTGNEPVTLLFSAKDTNYNNAVVLMQYLKMLGASK